jgi:hypothetical protein
MVPASGEGLLTAWCHVGRQSKCASLGLSLFIKLLMLSGIPLYNLILS